MLNNYTDDLALILLKVLRLLEPSSKDSAEIALRFAKIHQISQLISTDFYYREVSGSLRF